MHLRMKPVRRQVELQLSTGKCLAHEGHSFLLRNPFAESKVKTLPQTPIMGSKLRCGQGSWTKKYTVNQNMFFVETGKGLESNGQDFKCPLLQAMGQYFGISDTGEKLGSSWEGSRSNGKHWGSYGAAMGK